jgi:hypothetical protein
MIGSMLRNAKVDVVLFYICFVNIDIKTLPNLPKKAKIEMS